MVPGKDAGRLRHEVDAAEDNVVGLRTGCRFLAEQEGVALEVGVLDDLLALVVVAQDGHTVAQGAAGNPDTLVQLGGRAGQVLTGNFLPADVDRQLLRQ